MVSLHLPNHQPPTYNVGVRVSPAHAPHARAPWSALARIAAIGGACALLVIAGGRIVERWRLGADEAAARARVEADVRQEFDRIAARLRETSEAVFNPTLVRNAVAEDPAAARQLFTAARDALRGEDETLDAALTVFAANGRPIAWAGRPSEPPAAWLEGGEDWYFSRAALGHRVVYLRPISDGPNRIGTIVA